ncbi:hypothetical protein DUNSADRAFT_9836 [Dunaliella salina]|uniref:Gem-associated protein 5 TPR domain-containing protein n=1 Tax=Dunaliella salina TaxID=3046 RepID=A0ABQ7GGJ7_DUNSA|nr:hypothetical protein DUNSADRAFT_9836 [Dunaliella salina]|eukprot:KAF5833729.1 hypothetical protein DUNSADRAFT_9836 [Dunaliella salina]
MPGPAQWAAAAEGNTSLPVPMSNLGGAKGQHGRGEPTGGAGSGGDRWRSGGSAPLRGPFAALQPKDASQDVERLLQQHAQHHPRPLQTPVASPHNSWGAALPLAPTPPPPPSFAPHLPALTSSTAALSGTCTAFAVLQPTHHSTLSDSCTAATDLSTGEGGFHELGCRCLVVVACQGGALAVLEWPTAPTPNPVGAASSSTSTSAPAHSVAGQPSLSSSGVSAREGASAPRVLFSMVQPGVEASQVVCGLPPRLPGFLAAACLHGSSNVVVRLIPLTASARAHAAHYANAIASSQAVDPSATVFASVPSAAASTTTSSADARSSVPQTGSLASDATGAETHADLGTSLHAAPSAAAVASATSDISPTVAHSHARPPGSSLADPAHTASNEMEQGLDACMQCAEDGVLSFSLQQPNVPGGAVSCLAWLPGCRLLALACGDGSVQLWRLPIIWPHSQPATQALSSARGHAVPQMHTAMLESALPAAAAAASTSSLVAVPESASPAAAAAAATTSSARQAAAMEPQALGVVSSALDRHTGMEDNAVHSMVPHIVHVLKSHNDQVLGMQATTWPLPAAAPSPCGGAHAPSNPAPNPSCGSEGQRVPAVAFQGTSEKVQMGPAVGRGVGDVCVLFTAGRDQTVRSWVLDPLLLLQQHWRQRQQQQQQQQQRQQQEKQQQELLLLQQQAELQGQQQHVESQEQQQQQQQQQSILEQVESQKEPQQQEQQQQQQQPHRGGGGVEEQHQAELLAAKARAEAAVDALLSKYVEAPEGPHPELGRQHQHQQQQQQQQQAPSSAQNTHQESLKGSPLDTTPEQPPHHHAPDHDLGKPSGDSKAASSSPGPAAAAKGAAPNSTGAGAKAGEQLQQLVQSLLHPPPPYKSELVGQMGGRQRKGPVLGAKPILGPPSLDTPEAQQQAIAAIAALTRALWPASCSNSSSTTSTTASCCAAAAPIGSNESTIETTGEASTVLPSSGDAALQAALNILHAAQGEDSVHGGANSVHGGANSANGAAADGAGAASGSGVGGILQGAHAIGQDAGVDGVAGLPGCTSMSDTTPGALQMLAELSGDAGVMQVAGVLPKQAERQVMAALLRGDVRRALQIAVANRLLSADLVSVSASLGRPVWAAASRFYAMQQERAGQAHVAAMHLLAIGDREDAAAVYRRAGLLAEARQVEAST